MDQKNIRDAILKIISNEQAMQVLEHSIDSPKSAYEISKACGIPLTQVYRWIRKLHNLGFVRISGATNKAGKKYFMYQSKVRTINIRLNTSSSPQIEIS
ncbi:MAG: helix-turn-helix domain-containing protein [Nitrosotalea sp.]